MNNPRRRALVAALTIGSTGLTTTALAQEAKPRQRTNANPEKASAPQGPLKSAFPNLGWPTQTVKIVVPYAAGGTTDIAARLIANDLTAMWGQPVIVENKAGAATQIGTDQVAKSKDNHTLLVTAGPFVINTALYAKLPYDNFKDFLPITALMRSGMVLVTHPKSGINTLADVIAQGKTSKGVVIGSPGNGTIGHMSAELLADQQQLNLVHVPYRGATPMIADLVGGQIPLGFESVPTVSALIAEGKLKVVAFTDRKRSKIYPDVPTVSESGLPSYETINWWGMLAPSSVGEAIANKIHADVVQVIKTKAYTERFTKEGIEIGAISRESFGAFLAIEQIKWTKVVKARNIKAD
jgi:tripartite-type tricarboxylate transporter receptor subunit TctC